MDDFSESMITIRDAALERARYLSIIENLAALRGKKKPGRKPKWEALVNGYQLELGEEFVLWAQQFSVDLENADEDTREELLRVAVAIWMAYMVNKSRDELFEGYLIGLGDLEFDRARVLQVGQLMADNERYINNSLAPDMRTRLRDIMANPAILALGSVGILSELLKMQSRVEMYAGAQWAAIQFAVGEVAKENEAEGHGGVYWRLDPQAKHCNDCLDYGDRYYESYDQMLSLTGGAVPGAGVQCASNCRCSLEAEQADGGFARP